MLKQLKLNISLREQNNTLELKQTRQKAKKEKEEMLTKALEEATTPDDTNLIKKQIEEMETEYKDEDLTDDIEKIKNEITSIQKQLKDIEDKNNINNDNSSTPTNEEERGAVMNKLQTRELLKTGEYYTRKEVKDFYEQFKNLRSVGGESLTIPEIVINRIMDIMGDYTTLYPIINKIKVKGTARILIDTDTTAATWIEQTGAIAESSVGTITDLSFDGYKIGKITFVDNMMLQDSIINLDDYITKKIARAIALGLDKAILKGEGSEKKQPEGIITNLPSTHKVTVTSDKISDIVKHISLIDTGEDSIGEITAVMKRSTYYNRLLQHSINVNSSGDVVGKLPNLNNPDIVGLKIIFNQEIDENTILFGDFNQYTLIERENITIDKSEHIKFKEDQMAFRGKGRFDGKPTNKKGFVLVTLPGIVTV